MPRLRKTPEDRQNEKLLELYRSGRGRLDILDPQIAGAVGISERTFSRYKSDPCGKFTIRQLIHMGRVFDWSDEDFLAIIRAGQKEVRR